jgi:hypothetical protein
VEVSKRDGVVLGSWDGSCQGASNAKKREKVKKVGKKKRSWQLGVINQAQTLLAGGV